jgi:hypothetical protein
MSCEGKRRRRRGLVGSVGVGFWESPNVHVNLQDRMGGEKQKSLRMLGAVDWGQC